MKIKISTSDTHFKEFDSIAEGKRWAHKICEDFVSGYSGVVECMDIKIDYKYGSREMSKSVSVTNLSTSEHGQRSVGVLLESVDADIRAIERVSALSA